MFLFFEKQELRWIIFSHFSFQCTNNTLRELRKYDVESGVCKGINSTKSGKRAYLEGTMRECFIEIGLNNSHVGKYRKGYFSMLNPEKIWENKFKRELHFVIVQKRAFFMINPERNPNLLFFWYNRECSD